MKSVKTIFCLSFGLLLLNACDNERNCPVNPLDNGNQVKFQGSIGNFNVTRASGTTWDAGDAIGVYALKNNQDLPAGLYEGKENIKFTTPGDGLFKAATTGISFPDEGIIDFVAYYPFKETVNNQTFDINVANQTNSAAIDLLYSNNCKGKSKVNPDATLTFNHMLSMLVLNISAGDGVLALDGLTTSVTGLKTDGTFALSNGIVTLGTTSATITPLGTISGTSGVVAAILVPGQDLNTSKVTFTLAGQVFEWIPDKITLASGKRYTFTIQLSKTGLRMLEPKATIQDWDDADIGSGSVVLIPKEGADVLIVSTDAIQFEATQGDVKKISITASGAWTANLQGTGYTVSPQSGTGNAEVTIASTAASGATGKIVFSLNGKDVSKEVTISQKTSGEKTTNNLFPGSDFEEWNIFIGNLNNYGLKSEYSSQSENGRNNGKAFYLNGKPAGNDYVFTANAPSGLSFAGKTKIVFYIKGSADKSLSLNVYKENGVNYHVFNLETCTQEKTLIPAAENSSSNGVNSYDGTIDTSGNWVKVTLDISGLAINSTAEKNLFALKVGKNATYNLLVDDITLE